MNLIIRSDSIRWKGAGKRGVQTAITESDAPKKASLSFGVPLRSDSNTDPVEWIAAAHVRSFVLALSSELRSKVIAAGEFVTTATVTLSPSIPAGMIMNINLDVLARLPEMTQGEFIEATVRARASCLASRPPRANIAMNAETGEMTCFLPRAEPDAIAAA